MGLPTFDESITRMAVAVQGLARRVQPHNSFTVGKVIAAGGGNIVVETDGLRLGKEDLHVSVLLDYQYTQDDGAPNKLRAGDRVMMLSSDQETYDLTAKVS